jgi:23S rRNA (cytidine1920-2'-O)/16S rRNA (cytidine1409-2'-O)-methyltransferase
MTQPSDKPYVSRGGEKLAAALDAFEIEPRGWTCADLGSNVGGFVDCLLRRGAGRVYAVDTGYGVLAYALRTDPRVVVLERTNAMHVALPEPVDLVTIDVAWTPQNRILPAAIRLLKPTGRIISLVKPHYETDRKRLRHGVLDPADAKATFEDVCAHVEAEGLAVAQWIESPIKGQKGNVEYLVLLKTVK